MVVPWWVCRVFLDLGFVVEVVVVVGWGGGYGGWRWLAAATAFFCATFFLLASDCEKRKNGLRTWEREREREREREILSRERENQIKKWEEREK